MQNLNSNRDSGEYIDSTTRKSPRLHPVETPISQIDKGGTGESHINRQQEQTLDSLKNRLTEYMKRKKC